MDNMESMKLHWKDAITLFVTLAYMVKIKDPNGIDVYLSIDYQRHHRYKDTSPLVKILNGIVLIGVSNMEVALNGITFRYSEKYQKSDRIRRMNIYIFIDGMWADGNNLRRSIRNIVVKLDKCRYPCNQLGIQFIRFSNENKGIKRLVELDDHLDLS
jgi:hypothetical protein